jgi:predicted small lipoprotein YifL
MRGPLGFGVFASVARLLRTRSWVAVALIGAAAMTFAGCGIKGPLEPPPGAKAAGTAKSAESGDPGKNSDAPKKPHEPFVLDPLLR